MTRKFQSNTYNSVVSVVLVARAAASADTSLICMLPRLHTTNQPLTETQNRTSQTPVRSFRDHFDASARWCFPTRPSQRKKENKRKEALYVVGCCHAHSFNTEETRGVVEHGWIRFYFMTDSPILLVRVVCVHGGCASTDECRVAGGRKRAVCARAKHNDCARRAWKKPSN